jgi:hypothetical protein
MDNTQKKLSEKILQASQKINKYSLRGSADYIITPPSMMSLFRSRLRIDKIKRIFNE